MRAQQGRRAATGVTAEPIELIERPADMLARNTSRAAEARKGANRLAVEAWNMRMLGFQGPPQPSPALGDVLNAGYRYLEVKCLGCNTHQIVALDIVRRPKTKPVHELEATCAAASAPKSGAMPTSEAISSRCGRRRFQPAIRRQRGGRANGETNCFWGANANSL